MNRTTMTLVFLAGLTALAQGSGTMGKPDKNGRFETVVPISCGPYEVAKKEMIDGNFVPMSWGISAETDKILFATWKYVGPSGTSKIQGVITMQVGSAVMCIVENLPVAEFRDDTSKPSETTP